jgi:glucosyl-3-phosphoglycerate phosphatase
MSRSPSPRSSGPARAGFRTPGVLVIRHGLSEWNAAARWQGWADIDLAPEGVEQAEAAATLLKTWPRSIPVRVVVSDLVRTQQTAAPIVSALEADQPRVDAGFRERGVGEWSGKTTDEIETLWPGMLDSWREGRITQLPGGEDEDGFRSRVQQSLHAACTEAVTDRCAVVVVSHGGVIRTLERLHNVATQPVGNLGGRWFFMIGGEIRGGGRVNLRKPSSSAKSSGNSL